MPDESYLSERSHLSSDGYLLFANTFRLYVHGVREAFRRRLTDAFGDNWWARGVESSLDGSLLDNLRAMEAVNPNLQLHLLLQSSHFGWIVVKHHNVAFSDAFRDADSALQDFNRLNRMRNEWAHTYDMPSARAMYASDLMSSILLSLRREEALEIQRISQEFVADPNNSATEQTLDFQAQPESYPVLTDLTASPLELWRQLYSCLVVEKSVEIPDEDAEQVAKVTFKVQNTAPNSVNWPSVHFRSVQVALPDGVTASYGRGRASGAVRELGPLAPGEEHEANFSFPVNQLIDLEFNIQASIDHDELFQFQHSTALPFETIAPVWQQFVQTLDAVGIKEFVNDALNEIGGLDANMTLAGIADIRNKIRAKLNESSELQDRLRLFIREFHLSQPGPLGLRVGEISEALGEFEKSLKTLDDAIGRTDLALIPQAVESLKQIQLAVLRLDDVVKTMARSK